MSPWAWYWREEGDESYGEECASREAVIADAELKLTAGDHFEIIEARMSEATVHEGSDSIPFLRTRNHEYLVARCSQTEHSAHG